MTLQDAFNKYDVIEALTKDSIELSVGKLVPGDGEDAPKDLRKFFSSRYMATKVNAARNLIMGEHKILKMYSVRVYETDCLALIETGAAPI